MIKFELTYNEGELLHRILHDHLSEITHDMEINRIEGMSELLKWEATFMQKMIEGLEKQGIDVSAEMFGGYSE